MAQITDEVAIRFINEHIRPLAERIEAVDSYMQIVKARYTSIFSPVVSGNVAADTIEDGRQAEGVTRLTLGDIQNFATLVNNLLTQLETVGVRDVMRKPGVRKVDVNIG